MRIGIFTQTNELLRRFGFGLGLTVISVIDSKLNRIDTESCVSLKQEVRNAHLARVGTTVKLI